MIGWIVGISLGLVWILSIVFGLRKAIALDYACRGDRVEFLGYFMAFLIPVIFAPLFLAYFQIEWWIKVAHKNGHSGRIEKFFNPALAKDLKLNEERSLKQSQKSELESQIRRGDFRDNEELEQSMRDLVVSLSREMRELEGRGYNWRVVETGRRR